jgi:glycosyltransferase involved in cell wall biosynthesis
MKILLVNDYGARMGGAELQLLGLRAAFRARGHDARLLTSSARPAGLRLEADAACLGSMSAARTALQVANPWAFAALRRELAEFRPDVVHVKMFLTQLSPLVLPLLRAVPSLYHACWYRAVCPRGTKLLPDGSRCGVRWGRACLKNGCLPARTWPLLMAQMALLGRWRTAFRGVVANSAAVRARLLEEGFGPVEVISNGVPVVPLRDALVGPPTVAFAGRLEPEKGADLLLEALARVREAVPESRLLVAGTGSQSGQLRQLASRLRLDERVTFLGYLSRSEVEAAFRSAWVQAVPSRWDEPFGLVAAEALMRGTAVVASHGGGLADIVTPEETGLLVPPGDAAALAAALSRLLRDRELCERMGRAGREHALARLTESASAERFLQFYERLLQDGQRA